jgi:beta-1,4-mannosyl-glycoprotein beta-1,4-N-acetylglucosaminyltransferase
VKVIDTILYNGEPILELRLKLLYDIVDEFVLVEARTTFSGIRKAELFIEKYAAAIAPYKNKVTVIVVDSFAAITTEWLQEHKRFDFMIAGGYDNWYREDVQRGAATEYIRNECKSQKCIIMVCDVDELVKPEIVAALKLTYHDLNEPVKLRMQLFQYNFAWTRPEPWSAAFVVNDIGFRTVTPNSGRGLVGTPYFADTGWHASYFFNTAGLVSKLQSFSHQELNVDRYTNEAHVRRCIRTGADLTYRDSHDWELYDVSLLPLAVQQFQHRLLFLQEYT